ncbi:MarR family winged helix-turn-helix transcriptional regulator [Pseudonocardia sp. H11422]|uniref:MarR family winged helix-turn-helix transcriptional regulator n=1 Tax=Pseudonocardia sp. H11422 TaxID=2835866 RepID=UPI001BDC3E03|nr:MarR family winged helix-turn-helix transcriptional regulator [Pseudonocardia sp. H11422]
MSAPLPPDDPLVSALPGALGPFFRLIRAAVRADLPAPGLPPADVDLLRVVERHPGITVAGAADVLRVAPNTVSTRVRSLVDAGLLERRRGDGDRRRASLHLTAETRARLDAWAVHRAEVLGEVLGRLDATDREALVAALPALARLQALLAERPRGREGPDPTTRSR